MKYGPLALIALVPAACAPGPHPEPPLASACDAAPAQDLIGQPRGDALGTEALRRSGAKVLRWIPVGMMVTMEYRADRLNLRLGPDAKVTQITCG